MEFKNFFYQAAIYLLAAVISVPLAKRLGFGSVLGYLIAGIMIGPFMLGLVGENSQHVMHFAEFGVVMMLFLIGLELRPSLLWQLRAQILGLGLLQILLTTFVFSLIFSLLGYTIAASIVIGMILAMSSTAIVMQIFTEKGWLQTPVGQSTFSVLLFQDLAVIPIMAIIPLLALGAHPTIEADQSFISQYAGWQQGLISVGVILIIIFAGRFLLRPLFRFIAAANIREVFTAASLLLVIANALIMQLIGLSPALGTFIAGALLAESEYRHELEADIEPFKGLLLGLFFISVGANINFALVKATPLFIIQLVAILVFIKAAVLYTIAKIFKFNNQNSLLFTLGLAQGGEFCFVMLSHAVRHEALTNLIANQLVVAVAISMILTPLFIIFYERVMIPYFIKTQAKPFDVIPNKHNPVIIAGFGRVGQIIGRLLIANKIKSTVLDLDADNIELIRKFGFKVFYGDASRMDLLEAAGIEHAKLFILAIDDSQKALDIAMHVRVHYPNLKIMTRVRGRTQAYDFLKEGFDNIYRETFDSALIMAKDALQNMDVKEEDAEHAVSFFKKFDEDSLRRLFKLYGKEEEYIDEAKQSRRDLEKAFEADRAITEK